MLKNLYSNTLKGKVHHCNHSHSGCEEYDERENRLRMFSDIELCRDDDWKVIELFEKKDSIKREKINRLSKKSKEIHKAKKQRSFGHEKRP